MPDFVNDSIFGEQAQEMSGAPQNQAGAPPYPLYGIPPGGLSQDAVTGEASSSILTRPWFSYPVGVAIGFGLGWAFFGWFKPKYMKKNPSKDD